MFRPIDVEARTSWSARASAPGPRRLWARTAQPFATCSATCTTRSLAGLARSTIRPWSCQRAPQHHLCYAFTVFFYASCDAFCFDAFPLTLSFDGLSLTSL